MVFRTSTGQARYDHRFQTEGLRESIYLFFTKIFVGPTQVFIGSGKMTVRGDAFFGIVLKTYVPPRSDHEGSPMLFRLGHLT